MDDAGASFFVDAGSSRDTDLFKCAVYVPPRHLPRAVYLDASLFRPSAAAAAVGRFGIGFNSVYHLTELPAFVSAGKWCSFDPQAKFLPNVNPSNPGKMVDYMKYPETVQRYPDQVRRGCLLLRNPSVTPEIFFFGFRLASFGWGKRNPSSPPKTEIVRFLCRLGSSGAMESIVSVFGLNDGIRDCHERIFLFCLGSGRRGQNGPRLE